MQVVIYIDLVCPSIPLNCLPQHWSTSNKSHRKIFGVNDQVNFSVPVLLLCQADRNRWRRDVWSFVSSLEIGGTVLFFLVRRAPKSADDDSLRVYYLAEDRRSTRHAMCGCADGYQPVPACRQARRQAGVAIFSRSTLSGFCFLYALEIGGGVCSRRWCVLRFQLLCFVAEIVGHVQGRPSSRSDFERFLSPISFPQKKWAIILVINNSFSQNPIITQRSVNPPPYKEKFPERIVKTILQNKVIRCNQDFILSEAKDLIVNASKREAKDQVFTAVRANSSSPTNDNQAGDSLARFMESLQADHVSDNTIRSYAADIRRLVEFMHQRGRCELAAIQPADIDLFMRQLTIDDSSTSTIRRTRSGLKKFFRFLFENGIIAADPFEGASLEQSFEDRLTLSTILNIVVHCKRHYDSESTGTALRYRRDELILLLMIIFGVRQYHIAALRLSAMTKDGNAVVLAVSEEFSLKLEGVILQKLYHYLKSRDSKSDVIFIESNGKPVTARSIHSMMTEFSYATRVQINPRTLHHTFLHLQHHPDDASQLISELTKLEEDPQ